MFRGSRGDKAVMHVTHSRNTRTLRTHAMHTRYAHTLRTLSARGGHSEQEWVLWAAVVFKAVSSLSSPFKRKEVKTFFNEIQFAKRTQ